MKSAKKDAPASWTGRSFLSDPEVRMAADLETTLRKLSEEEYDRLFRHGYEVTETTLVAYEHRAFDV